jgi:predicted nucleic acid-binding Zn ribbon protein
MDKPRRKKSGPLRIGEMLQEFLQQAMPKTVGDELRVFGAWPKAVGQDISRQARPIGFRNGILFVETKHPIWTSELTAKRHQIQKKLNAALGQDIVRDIHFRQARL